MPLPNIFPSKGFAISPSIGAPIDAKSLNGIAPPFCHFFRFPPMCQMPFFTDCFPRILKKYSFLCSIVFFNYSKKSSTF